MRIFSTVKSVIILVVTSIKQSSAIKGQHFVIPNIHFKLTCIVQPPALKNHFDNVL